LRASCTNRTARSLTSVEYLFVLLMAPFSQEMEPPQFPGRFKHQWLFPGKNRSGDTPVWGVDECLRRSLAVAGLEKMRVHDCRHVYASLLAQNGVSLYVIQSCLRHQDPKMTMIYAHLCDDSRRQANLVIDRLVGQAISANAIPPEALTESTAAISKAAIPEDV